jgi:hypothetical protein
VWAVVRRARPRRATGTDLGVSLEFLYTRFGRDILAQAAADPALSEAIAREVFVLDRAMEAEELPPDPAALQAFLAGYGQGVVDSAVIRPDLVARDTSCGSDYPSSVVRLGALTQRAFAGGLLTMSPPAES